MRRKYYKFTDAYMAYLEERHREEPIFTRWVRRFISRKAREQRQRKKDWQNILMSYRSVSFAQGFWQHNVKMVKGVVMAR